MPQVEFEPTVSAGVLPQTYALDHAATGTGYVTIIIIIIIIIISFRPVGTVLFVGYILRDSHYRHVCN
jgi:hypothetical protein